MMLCFKFNGISSSMDVVSSTFFYDIRLATPFPSTKLHIRTEDRSIANYKIRNHYLSVEMLALFPCTHTHIKSKTSSCVVHFVDYIYFFICYLLQQQKHQHQTAAHESNKVFEWWLFGRMMKASTRCTHTHWGCEEEREKFFKHQIILPHIYTHTLQMEYHRMVEYQFVMLTHMNFHICHSHTLKTTRPKMNAVFFLIFVRFLSLSRLFFPLFHQQTLVFYDFSPDKNGQKPFTSSAK